MPLQVLLPSLVVTPLFAQQVSSIYREAKSESTVYSI